MSNTKIELTRIDQIRERLAKATPGPWEWQKDYSGRLKTATTEVTIVDADGDDMAHIEHGENENDKDLIAHAPADIAWLLERLAAAEAVVYAADDCDLILTMHDGKDPKCMLRLNAALARWKQGS